MDDVNYLDPNAPEDEGHISPDVDYLRECPVCHQYRHKSWFHVGERGCWGCYHHHKLWVAALSAELQAASKDLN
jgi:hypothetical protein